MKIVCISDIKVGFSDINFPLNLTVGKIYNSLDIFGDFTSNDDLCCVTNDSNFRFVYDKRRFVTLDEWREKQIRELLG